MSKLRIVLANGMLPRVPKVGGLWALGLQYFLGLRDLGHELLWLELFPSTGNEAEDDERMDLFFNRMKGYGLDGSCAVLIAPKDEFYPDVSDCKLVGRTEEALRTFCSSADVMWNFACSFRQPLLSLCPYRVLIDGDPGHLQVAALDVDLSIADHDVFFTVGGKVGDPDCEVPTLGLEWRHFLPVLYLPMWEYTPAPPSSAPYTSITQWNWEELHLDDRVLSISKRDAYLRVLDLPVRADRAFELATFIHPDDDTGDLTLLDEHKWGVIDAFDVMPDAASYRDYIVRSRGELCCVKPVYRELNTGWISERSACYMATGRPVLAEETGFSEVLPTGTGLLPFTDTAGAVAALQEIESDYEKHRRAGRELVEEYMDSQKALPRMLSP